MAERRLVFALPSPNAPESQPPARGLHGTTPMSYFWQVGSTSFSMPRTRIEYGGCSVTNRSRIATLRHPLRFDDLVGREGRAAEVADLPDPHQIGQGAQRLVDVGIR
jgi:hypothetical protein